MEPGSKVLVILLNETVWLVLRSLFFDLFLLAK